MTSLLRNVSDQTTRPRNCCRQGCNMASALAMSYDYAQKIVAVGPLGEEPHPTLYELCLLHGELLSVPRGWRIDLLAGAPVRPRSMDVIDLASRRSAAAQRV